MVSLAEVAAAYRILAGKINHPFTRPVADGLRDSVSFGMAHNANAPGLFIAGKTGTANEPREPWSHGWFAGFTTLHNTSLVIALYLRQGNGADAASFARNFFSLLNEGNA